ncbi:DUF1489 domain-containing protein [Asticcacaulis sp. EMRT-3]|uniref:DUF1489 family protein n=1 Tax=Asticcacaulis sp. EMRT-3 TaxID=3040349 RepID=UPI0024AFEEF9|nr:DUF1489 domain-containing protein [Asticcacaulis sp. EMRT-3]MDI7775036.1 DUF1489 domain-containing protein [Asticcacaulis sp. EMRT-3]
MSEIHLVKLCVGADSVDDLRAWEKVRGEISYVHTRNQPKQAQELLDGGSLYWVIKGHILCRREIVSIDYDEAAQQCLIGLSTRHFPTESQPRRPFQGWRYLKADDAPRDLSEAESDLPPEMTRALKEAGVW